MVVPSLIVLTRAGQRSRLSRLAHSHGALQQRTDACNSRHALSRSLAQPRVLLCRIQQAECGRVVLRLLHLAIHKDVSALLQHVAVRGRDTVRSLAMHHLPVMDHDGPGLAYRVATRLVRTK